MAHIYTVETIVTWRKNFVFYLINITCIYNLLKTMHRYEFHESDNNWWHSKSKTNVKAVAWKPWMIKKKKRERSAELWCRVSHPLSVTILFPRHFLNLNLILFFLNESLTVDKLTNRVLNAREYNWKYWDF